MSTLSSANVTDVNLVLKERTHMRLCLNMLIFTHNLGNWLMLSTFNVSCQSTVGDMSINRRRHVNQPSATCQSTVGDMSINRQRHVICESSQPPALLSHTDFTSCRWPEELLWECRQSGLNLIHLRSTHNKPSVMVISCHSHTTQSVRVWLVHIADIVV